MEHGIYRITIIHRLVEHLLYYPVSKCYYYVHFIDDEIGIQRVTHTQAGYESGQLKSITVPLSIE